MQPHQSTVGFGQSAWSAPYPPPPAYSQQQPMPQVVINTAQPAYQQQEAPPSYAHVQRAAAAPPAYVQQQQPTYASQLYAPPQMVVAQPIAAYPVLHQQPQILQSAYVPQQHHQQSPQIIVNVNGGQQHAAPPAAQMEHRRFIINEKMISLGGDYTIKDQYDCPCFNVRGKLMSVGDKIVIEDMMQNAVLKIKEEVFNFMPTFNIVSGSDKKKKLAVIKKKFASKEFKVKSVYGDYGIQGVNVIDRAFIMAKNGNIVGTVGKKRHAATDTYGVEIDGSEDAAFILAMVIVIDRVLFN